MKRIRLGIIGMGSMGTKYAELILQNDLGFDIVAITRIKADKWDRIKDYFKTGLLIFESDDEMFKAIDEKKLALDAILVVTPHYFHRHDVMEGLRRGLYVLCDKPLGVFLQDGREILEYDNDRVGYIFHQREYPIYKALKELIDSKQYGNVKRVCQIATDWYRPNSYYKSSTWRATYKTDGGGTIINQCPHSLDMLCYLFGLPNRVMSFNHYGKYHPIEVEDESTSYLEWENGVTGVFVASTGEAPGINRIEISLDRAVIACYKDYIEIKENPLPEPAYRNMDASKYQVPTASKRMIHFEINNQDAYLKILTNFYRHIVNDEKLVVSIREAINSLYLGNAIYLSGFTNKMVRLYPLGTEEELEFEKDFAKELLARY